MARTFDSLRFDAGSLSLNLVATVGRRYGRPVERLGSVARLHEWLDGVRVRVDGEATDDDLEQLRRLREDLHALFRAAVSGERPSGGAVSRVNAAAERGPQLRSTADGLAARGLDPLIALIAADAIRILAGSDRDAIRVCDADDCSMLYLARGERSRRWCSSATCGNRSRVAAHRARSRAA
jgi:predicted RNA-binding Zn ribbon-like protein